MGLEHRCVIRSAPPLRVLEPVRTFLGLAHVCDLPKVAGTQDVFPATTARIGRDRRLPFCCLSGERSLLARRRVSKFTTRRLSINTGGLVFCADSRAGNRTPCAPPADKWPGKTHAFGVDDNRLEGKSA